MAGLRYGRAGAPADGGEDAPEEHAGDRHVVEREQRAGGRADEVDELQRPALHGKVRRPQHAAHLDVLVVERGALFEAEELLLHSAELQVHGVPAAAAVRLGRHAQRAVRAGCTGQLTC